MWKKDEQPETYQPVSRTDAAGSGTEAPTARRSTEKATIGPSIVIRGEVSGGEDLLVQGRVEGSIDLGQNTVTVGKEGHVKAGISARIVTVEGKVEGNLSAEEQVILRSSARVEGDITAPRVILEDGANFRGGVDMGEAPDRNARRSATQPREEKKLDKNAAPLEKDSLSQQASAAAN